MHDGGAFGQGHARLLAAGVLVHHRARHERTDEVAHAVGDEVDEPLRRGADAGARLLVSVDLPAHEEEVVADAMQQDAAIDVRHDRAQRALAEEEVAERPGTHPHQHDRLDPETPQREREQQHEDDLRHLPEGLDKGRVRRPHLIEVGVGEGVVELERDAEQEAAQHKDRERPVLEQRQRIQA